jgi:hypothetical protein
MALLSSPFEDITMQVFGNIATASERKESRTTGKGYYQFRICESQRGVDNDPTWYTVRVMKDEDPLLNKGDFVKVTGKLKADFYIGRDGKPTGALLIIAFEASKISKNSGLQESVESGAPAAPKETVKDKVQVTPLVRPQATAPVKAPIHAQEQQEAAVALEDSNWSTLYN